MSAAEAVAAGATYLVIGRPITGAADPRAAAEQIAAQLRSPTRAPPGVGISDAGAGPWPARGAVRRMGRCAYFAVMTKCPRRFCCQQLSLLSVQKGVSLPLLITVMRSAGTPRLTR